MEAGEREIQRGRATVLFVDVLGYNALADATSPDDAYTIITRCLRLLDGVARRHGGAVDKYLGDALMVVFGLPTPLPDASGAAQRAALQMRSLLHEYRRDLRIEVPLELQIGINTGEVVSGEIRGEALSEFLVMGDAVNIAARLKGRAAPGAIYVGAATHTASGEDFRYKSVGELELTGKRGRVNAHELLSSREDSSQQVGAGVIRFTPFVGRKEELAELHRCAVSAAAGVGATVVVRGPEGIGKSRLVVELARALPPGLEAREIGRAAHPRRQRRSVFASSVARASRLQPSVLAETIAAHARSEPLVLVIEEADRLGTGDLQTVRELTRLTAAAPLLLILVGRCEVGPDPLELLEIAAEPSTLDMDLAPLSSTEQDLLIDHLARDAPRAQEAHDVIRARALGNPLRIIHAAFLASALLADRQREPRRRAKAERRRASVLFADLSGFTAMTETTPAEEAFFIVQGCLEALDRVAQSFGGVVDKHLGDCVLATFGVPIAMENSAEAALNAAIAMRRRVAEYSRECGLEVPLQAHFGVETGRAIAGDVSGPVIREYALMGDSVNVASRLEDLAPPGAIYVGEQAWRSARDRFQFRARPPIQLRGRTQDVATYELLSHEEQLYRTRASERRGVHSELVGREAEMERLRGALSELANGRGAVVSVVAEAGLGKSRIVEELRLTGEAQALRWLEGRCLAVGRDLSFHPFADLLRGWSAIESTREADESAVKHLRDALEGTLPERAESVLPFLASVLRIPLDPESRERLAGIEGDVLARFVMGSVREWLRAVASQAPVVVVFEDLHWADESSVDLLESLLGLAEQHPVLFLHVLRPGYETSERVRARATRELGDRHLEVELRPLAREDSRRLIRNLFRGGDLPHSVRASIEERAAGNPFFVEEVVRNLLEEGAVEVQGDTLVATDRIHDAVIPGSIEEALLARIDRLDPERKEILDAAAVVGGTFDLAVLEKVTGKDRLREALARMEDAGLIVESPTGTPDELAFKHPLIHEVAYERLLRDTREALHGRVGRAIEEVMTEQPGFHAMLAYHYGRARDAERAEQHLFLAGDEAARAAASNEALRYFREAARVYVEIRGEAADPAKLAELQGSVALALYNRGRLIEAVEYFDGALELLGVPVVSSGLARNAGLAWNLLRALGQALRPDPRQKRPSATERDQQMIQLLFKRGLAQTTTAPTRFVADTLAGLNTLSQLDPGTVTNAGGLYAHAAVGIFSWGGLSFGLAHRFLEKSRRVIERAPERNVLINYRAMKFVHHFLEGDWSGAHAIDDEMLEKSLHEGRLWEVTTYLGLDAELLIAQGQFERARERIGRVDEIWETYQYDLAKSNHHALPTFLALEERRLEDAVRHAESYYEEIPDDPLHLLALSAKADAQLLQGDSRGANGTLARGRPILESAGATAPPFHRGRFLLSELSLELVDAAAALGSDTPEGARAPLKKARRHARQACSAAKRVALRRPVALRMDGRRAWLERRQGPALRTWERALETCRRLGTRPEEARVHAELAVWLAESDPTEAAAHREQALQAFSDLGLKWDRARLEAGIAP